MPVELIVEPYPKPGDVPLSIGFDGRRCRLVYALRGNPEADVALDGADEELLQPVIEAMVAHELAHCWRYLRGAWHTVPAGFTERRHADRDPALERLRADMRQSRREEGYADLVGLAWTRSRHPALYSRVHDWFWRVRARPAEAVSTPHDTASWLALVAQPSAFPQADTPFDEAFPLWREGLATER